MEFSPQRVVGGFIVVHLSAWKLPQSAMALVKGPLADQVHPTPFNDGSHDGDHRLCLADVVAPA